MGAKVIPEPAQQTGDRQNADATGTPPTGHTGRHATQLHESTGLTEAEVLALAAASQRGRRPAQPPKRPSRLSWGLPLLISVGVGVAAVLIKPAEYRCTALIAPPNVEKTGIETAIAQSDLSEILTEAFPKAPTNATERAIWDLHTTHDGKLSVALVSSEPDQVRNALNGVLRAFTDKMTRRIRDIRDTPTTSETLLHQYVDSLEADLSRADTQVQQALETLPDADPRPAQGELLSDWHQTRDEFQSTRLSLAQAASTFTKLQNEPEPTHGLVSFDERQAAIRSDKALQSDLNELSVNLAEARLHMLTATSDTPALLDGLSSASTNLKERIDSSLSAEREADVSRILTRLSESARSYHDALGKFAATWRRSLERLRSAETDPQTAVLLDIHREMSQGLSDFFYTASALLTSMRSGVNDVGQLRGDNARRHVLQSTLAREFQLLQTAHHRFEFSAGKITPSTNFKLDAALRSAQGLHRRSQARLHDIDAQLARVAAERASERHAAALHTAEQLVGRIRDATDQTVDRLVELQGRLNISVQDANSFHENLRQLEVAVGRLEVIRGHLNDMQARLVELQDRRLAVDADPGTKLLSFETDDLPVNRMARLQFGGLTFGLVFAALMLGQWWMRR